MICNLCMNNCNKFENLTTEAVYKLTIQYFEAELINDTNTSSNVICEYCWLHITDFNSFQENVRKCHEEKCKTQITKGFEQEEVVFPFVSVFNSYEVNVKSDPDEIPYDNDQNIPTEQQQMKVENYENSNHDNVLENQINILDTEKSVIENKIKKSSRVQNLSKQSNKISSLKKKTKNTKTHQNTDAKVSDAIKKLTTKDKSIKLKRKITLDEDAFITSWKLELQCEICQTACKTFRDIRAHFREQHSDEKAYVTCCQQKYYHRFHLVDHLQVHLDPKYFKCPKCERCCINRRSLVNHIKNKHSTDNTDRKFECNVCHKFFAKLAILREHASIHATGNKDFVCSYCNKGFVLESKLRIHIRNVHTKNNCVCEICGKWFRHQYALKNHMSKHDESSGAKLKWQCNQCNAVLSTKFSLGRHIRVAHHDGSTAYICAECGKVSLNKEALRAHKKYVHESERKFKCNICDKAFKVSGVLKEHMSTHTGQDLYQCPHCPKTFKVSSNMHHHRKKMHPKEWAENRQHRAPPTVIDQSRILNEVVL
ncbi:transcription factor grauzone-like [Teleopsis dalmanni]|uniref:transcription factor grauzone-like n=1 Tax=Teleopsis dalmanni TaxID=139649 RepID=UPI0018CF2007|nr:transcription factor grauzone-like [Teleopsis dalmanni]